MKIGLIGIGTIGSYLARRIGQDKELQLGFVFDTNNEKVKDFPKEIVVNSIEEAIERNVKLVVECASWKVVKEHAAKILLKRDLLILSVAALAFRECEEAVKEATAKSGKNLFVPSGAIIGIDGIHAFRDILKKVSLVTRKPPRGLGRNDMEETVVFNGTAREACKQFPKNVNISATISLNGIGFDKTKVKIISDPKAEFNTHWVEAAGDFGKFTIQIEGRPSKNPRTSSTTAISVFDTIKRIQKGIGLFQ